MHSSAYCALIRMAGVPNVAGYQIQSIDSVETAAACVRTCLYELFWIHVSTPLQSSCEIILFFHSSAKNRLFRDMRVYELHLFKNLFGHYSRLKEGRKKETRRTKTTKELCDLGKSP